MRRDYSRPLKLLLVILLLAGLGVSALALLAGQIGIDRHPGFGADRARGLVGGIGLTLLSGWLLGSARGRKWAFALGEALSGEHIRQWACAVRGALSARPAPGAVEVNVWPTPREAVLVGVVAAVVTAVDIYLSTQLGLLSYPPNYDGISYVVGAKSHFYHLLRWLLHPRWLVHAAGLSRVTLWQALMVLSFLVLGEGEWQAFTARFWPAFLLLLLVVWVVRRRGGSRAAWVAVVFTSLLPTISVGLRSSAWEYFTKRANFGWEWYLADLRPDLLFAVLLLWTVVPLVEHVRTLDARTLLVSGSCAGLAVLAKPSASPMLLLAWGLAAAYVVLVNRRRPSFRISACLWALLPFGILVFPWAFAGGARLVAGYLYSGLTAQRVLYANPHATFLSEALYYWKLFPYHMGRVEGWAILAGGLGLYIASLCKRTARRDIRMLAYLGLSAALYGLVSATPNKNYFVGLPYYLLLWVFAWAVLGPILGAWTNRSRVGAWILVCVSCIYGGAMVAGGVYAVRNWPAEQRRAGPEDREVTRRIAKDLRAVLTDDDTFMWVPAYGYPGALQYYMMDTNGEFPQAIWCERPPFPPPDQTIRQYVSRMKAILVYKEDPTQVARFHYSPAVTWPYLRAIAEWVKRPGSSHRLVRTYHLSVRSPPLGERPLRITWPRHGDRDRGGLTIQLYVKRGDGGSTGGSR